MLILALQYAGALPSTSSRTAAHWHTFFWQNLSPSGGDKPTGDLASAIDEHFGTFDAFQAQKTQAVVTVQGSGWGALAWEPLGQRLYVEQIYDHQGNVGQSGQNLLVIDAWEHAYYLQYKTEKTKFFEAVWNLWNWDDVSARYAAARKMNLLVPETVEQTATR